MPYIGSAPTKVVSRQSATVYRYTATAGQTVFSGADLDNAVLACNPADMIVHINGIRLESTDYTATSTSVTLVVAAAAGDEVTVTSFQTFEVADTYDKATADTRYVNASGDTMTGGLTGTSATFSGDLTVDTNTLYVDSANNRVGIGTSSPNEKLTVNGTIESLTDGQGEGGHLTLRAQSSYSYRFNVDNHQDNLRIFREDDVTISNGVVYMNIDASGRVTMPYQPAFRAGRNSNYTVTAGHDIVFDTTSSIYAHFNTGGHYNTSNGRFTCPVAGTYLFYAQVIFGPNLANGQAMDDAFYIHRNNTRVIFSAKRAEYVDGYTGNSGYYVDHAQTIVSCNANDFITVNSNRLMPVHGNPTYSVFYGYLLG